jgi:hypothetical protein
MTSRTRVRALALGLGLVLAAALVKGAVGLVERIPEALRGMETFRVVEIEMEGTRHLGRDAAVAAAGIPQGASVWDDLSPWSTALAGHPLVRAVKIQRRLPSTLVLVVEERDPVALLPTPTLEPVDEEGHLLPLDPALHPLDLPLLRVEASDTLAVRLLAAELARLGRVEPAFLGEVSEAEVDERGDLVARWGGAPVTFRFRKDVPPVRLRDGVRAMEDAARRQEGEPPASVDLRWADQVVVRPR